MQEWAADFLATRSVFMKRRTFMQPETILTAAKAARFFGRCAVLPGGKQTFFNWSGAGFVFHFKGTCASAYLLAGADGAMLPRQEERAYIGVFVDDMPLQTARFSLDCAADWYTLAENLPSGEHTVRVVKQTEIGYGRAAVMQLRTDGVFLDPPPEQKLRLEFAGDSITCGYGNICTDESPEFKTHEENFSLTFAALTAMQLKAEVSCIAASGNGFYHDYGCNTGNLIPELYRYTDRMLFGHMGLAAKKWDFAHDRCDAVIVKLGQNDWQYCAGADLTAEQRTPPLLAERRVGFQAAAEDFFLQIRSVRPNTPVILIYESCTELQAELRAAATRVCGIHLLRISEKQPYEGVGANGHWSVCTHARVAAELCRKLREVLCLP